MRNHKLSWLALSVAGAFSFSSSLWADVTAQPSVTSQDISPVDWLLRQVRAGEATNKYDLVTQALYRLDKIAPDNPEVMAAKIRLALHQGDQAKAQQIMADLKKIAPNAHATRQSAANLMLVTPEGRQQLQQARLFATAGRLNEARTQYDALFKGDFPSVELALEYWRLVARLPGGEREAKPALQALEKDYPDSTGVRMALARIALAEDNQREAVAELQRIATDPTRREEAAQVWLADITGKPVTSQTVAELQQYLQTFTRGDAQTKGQAELTRQQQLLADPAYQQRVRGLGLIDKGAGAQAIPALRAALLANPNDGELLGAMGQALARNNQRAEANDYFQRAIGADAESYRIDKWRSLLTSNQYWLAIDRGDKALEKGDIEVAQRHYQQARNLDNRDAYALIGLGDVAIAQRESDRAEALYQQALRIEPGNGTAARRLAGLYQQQSPQKALSFVNGLSAGQQRALGDTVKSLRSETRRAEADALAEQGNWAQAAARYRQAQQDAPDDVWLNYRLAGALRQAGQAEEADRLMAAMAAQRAQDPAQVYAYGLYLSSTDRHAEAIQQLQRLPRSLWNENITALAARLEADQLLARANAMRDAGNEAGAETLLRQQPPSTRLRLTLADWALQRGEAEQALQTYRAVLKQEADNGDAQLGEIDALVALNRLDEARTHLTALPPKVVSESLNTGRRVANAWQSVGEPGKALTLFAALKPNAQPPADAQSRALVWRDAARVEQRQRQPQQALADYAQAMVASGITPSTPLDNDTFTRLTRNNASDDWLKRSIRSDAADLYRRQDTTVTLEQDYSRSKGTGGYSDYTGYTTMLQVDTPIADGKGFFRADQVHLNAGRFSPDAEGKYSANFGTCDLVACDRDYHQRADGVSVAAGWANDRWSADLGTTPIGFEVVDWVGGITWNTDVQNIGLSFTASRRPIASSMLAFAGATDPNTGNKWGGVRATGGAIGLSYDRGGAHGVWADISAHQLTGKNVEDNSRERLMAGYYYKLINENNRRATVGLNTMLWHYQKDLSDYYYSQGGYYSPQRYVSLAVPVNYRQRTENWSFEVGGAVSWSRSHTDTRQRYPLLSEYADLRDAGSSSQGFGYTLQAIIERRVSNHWTVGLGVDVQQAKDYTPSHGLLYVRYSMAGWQGDLDLPPQPLVPYADFK